MNDGNGWTEKPLYKKRLNSLGQFTLGNNNNKGLRRGVDNSFKIMDDI